MSQLKKKNARPKETKKKMTEEEEQQHDEYAYDYDDDDGDVSFALEEQRKLPASMLIGEDDWKSDFVWYVNSVGQWCIDREIEYEPYFQVYKDAMDVLDSEKR